MTHEHPHHGGSYVRQKDGSLKRADDTTPATDAPAAAEPASPTKPAAKTKAEK